MREAYAARVRTIPVVYHPSYLAGRVVQVTRNEVVLQPPMTSTPVIVRDFAVSDPAAILPVGTYATVPVTYSDGGYQLYTAPAYSDTTYSMPNSCDSSSSMYAALLPTVIGALTGNGGVNGSDLTAIALSALASGGSYNSCAPYAYTTAYPGNYNTYPGNYNTYPGNYNTYPVYNTVPQYGAYPVSVPPVNSYPGNAYPVPSYPVYNSSPQYGTYPQYSQYPTAYDNCMWTDNDGDENSCAAGEGSGYTAATPASYGNYGMYAPQQVQGLVVAKTGSVLMVLGANGMNPVLVDASPALQNGYNVNGPVSIGQVIDAYGYYNGNTFEATELL